jgi:hypothetical protein
MAWTHQSKKSFIKGSVLMALKKSQQSLKDWTNEDWGTKSGKPSTQGSEATGERYLPKAARESLSSAEYAATSKKKREDTKRGKQFSKQPKKIAKKTARHRANTGGLIQSSMKTSKPC